MARTIVGYCDNHAFEDKVLGDTHRVDLGTGPREFESCDDCWQTMTVAELEKLVAEHGRDVSDNGDEKKKLRCPWCLMSLASLKTLRDHIGTKHSERVGEFISLFAQAKAAPRKAEAEARPVGERRSRRTESRECEHCGRVCESPQGLGAHMRGAHGIEGSSPSVVAKRRAQG